MIICLMYREWHARLTNNYNTYTFLKIGLTKFNSHQVFCLMFSILPPFDIHTKRKKQTHSHIHLRTNFRIQSTNKSKKGIHVKRTNDIFLKKERKNVRYIEKNIYKNFTHFVFQWNDFRFRIECCLGEWTVKKIKWNEIQKKKNKYNIM